ncbi:TPA: hypothetical protein ACH3X1_009922 [Trebouxia sp. C0004]
MQTSMMRSTTVQSRTQSRTSSFTASRACPKARKHVVVSAQAEDRTRGPAKAASALLAAVAAAQLALTGTAQAFDIPFLKDTPQILSPGDATDIKEGKGQDPSSKYVDQARSVVGGQAADMLKNSPDINKEGGGVGNTDIKMESMQAKGFSQDKQATGGKDTPKDIRGGTPTNDAPKFNPGFMNALPDMSAAPIASKDAAAANDGKANLPKAGGFSKAVTSAGKGLIDALPNAPDISNPKAASGKPTVGKLTKGSNPVKDVADADLGDNKPNFPTPDVNTSQTQDIFKQLGDKIRGAEPSAGSAANPGKIGESIANNINGPDPKGAASEVSKNLPDIAQKTDIAPESIGAKANVRN